MRIRSIKPEFWRSDDVSALDPVDRLLFVGIWSYVDDNGVGLDKLAAITADLFAADLEADPPETFARVSRGLRNLAAAGLIVRYTVEGRAYLAVTGWSRHQRIDKPGKTRYPGPDQEIHDTLATPSRVSRDTLAPGTGEQGNRGTEEQGGAADPPPVDNSGESDPHGSTPDLASDPEPETRCAPHTGLARPPACGACKDARLEHEQWQVRTLAAEKRQTARPAAWDVRTHCEHGQIRGACEVCAYEASRADTVIVGPWRAAPCDVDAARSPART